MEIESECNSYSKTIGLLNKSKKNNYINNNSSLKISKKNTTL